jgi:hypothetical protein
MNIETASGSPARNGCKMTHGCPASIEVFWMWGSFPTVGVIKRVFQNIKKIASNSNTLKCSRISVIIPDIPVSQGIENSLKI